MRKTVELKKKCDIISASPCWDSKVTWAYYSDIRRIIMSVSYNRLWKLLIDKNMSVAEMRRAADIAPNTVTRMKKDQEVTLTVLEKICKVLDADFGDIVEYKK